MPRTIKVGVITQAQGAHLADYFAALAKIDEVEAVALADPSGKSADAARQALGDKYVFTGRGRQAYRTAPHPHLSEGLPIERPVG
jgi:predicted dehydrogenase